MRILSSSCYKPNGLETVLSYPMATLPAWLANIYVRDRGKVLFVTWPTVCAKSVEKFMKSIISAMGGVYRLTAPIPIVKQRSNSLGNTQSTWPTPWVTLGYEASVATASTTVGTWLRNVNCLNFDQLYPWSLRSNWRS